MLIVLIDMFANKIFFKKKVGSRWSELLGDFKTQSRCVLILLDASIAKYSSIHGPWLIYAPGYVL